MNKLSKIAIVDDDASVRDSLSQMLEIRDYNVVTYEDGKKFLQEGNLADFDCFVVDVKMPGISGIEVIHALNEKNINVPTIVITGHGDVAVAVEAMKKGAYDFQEKPFEKQYILGSIARAVEKSQLLKETLHLKFKLEHLQESAHFGLIGESKAIENVRKKITQYSNTPASVLITGETGTGKELVARALHDNSPRRDQRFVAINMATLLESTYYSEIFGHEKGSFTGAIGHHEGKLEYAHNGTVFLDEIDSMPAHMQPILLRVLEEKSFTRMGNNVPTNIDIRVISATNQDIHKLVAEGKFRRDLFHRLNVLHISIPPLRERIEDIPLLAHNFLKDCCRFYGYDSVKLTPSILQKMKSYSWPGNIRELKNTIESMILSCDSDTISEWPNSDYALSSVHEDNTQEQSLKDAVENFERDYIAKVLESHSGNLKKAAQKLQISPRTLFDKMKKLDLKKEDFKHEE